MVVISFFVIVSCIYISLLLVTVGIMYSRMGRSINVVISILFDGENTSFDASLVMYFNLLLHVQFANQSSFSPIDASSL